MPSLVSSPPLLQFSTEKPAPRKELEYLTENLECIVSFQSNKTHELH